MSVEKRDTNNMLFDDAISMLFVDNYRQVSNIRRTLEGN